MSHQDYLNLESIQPEGLILSESWWDDPAPEDKSPKRSSRPQLQNEPYISLTEKDILKHHKLKELEREDLMNTIEEINLYLDENPTALHGASGAIDGFTHLIWGQNSRRDVLQLHGQTEDFVKPIVAAFAEL